MRALSDDRAIYIYTYTGFFSFRLGGGEARLLLAAGLMLDGGWISCSVLNVYVG